MAARSVRGSTPGAARRRLQLPPDPPKAGPSVDSDAEDIEALRRSGLFDEAWFMQRNPDLARADLDPLVHFHRFGWREGRWPNAYFDPVWYLERHHDVRDSGADPLLHYAEYGEAEDRTPILYFDPAWYRCQHSVAPPELCLAHFLARRCTGTVSPVAEFDASQYLRLYPDVAAAGMDPFEHYILQGARENRVPSVRFDPVFYRRRYLAGHPEANPLLHFLAHRSEPGVHPLRPDDDTDIPREVRRSTQPHPEFETLRPVPAVAKRRAKLLAFYLPQFHPVPENDAWWGAGFTEWTNLGRALPRFAGHYQPRIPRDLGHYRLDDPEVLRRQIALAQAAGLHGFVFYFYWFNGHRLLDGPLEMLLADPSLEIPFCLMWANENWTRRWDGSDSDVLISQDYRRDDEPMLLETFVRHFQDPRYIRLGGRPVLMVYRARCIPDPVQTVARWRKRFRDAFDEDPIFVMAQSFTDRDPRAFGMDAAVEFPPHKLVAGIDRINTELQFLDPGFSADVYAYDDVVRASVTEPAPAFPLIKTAVPSWDNDARRQGAGLVLHGSTPGKYQEWLEQLIRRAQVHPVEGEALVCLNAWNEWTEGAYLEPDIHFGAAYLNATGRAVAGTEAVAKLLLVGHDAFPSGAQHLLLNLGRQLRRAHGIEIAFLLLGGGKMLPAYAEIAPVSVAADASSLAQQVKVASARGFRTAIINTSAAAQACAVLHGAGIVCTLLVHELPRLLRERGLIDAAREGTAASARVVFACSHVRDRFQEMVPLAPERAAILPQGVYRPARTTPSDAAWMRAQLHLRPGAVLALGVGYADLRKGFDLFLQVWRAAQTLRAQTLQAGSEGPEVHLAWIGDMDPAVHAYLGAEMAAAEASGTFHYLGRRTDAADWFAASDVHLLTSREDAFPSVVLEAMSAGVPTLAFEESGGIPDLLREHGAGESVAMGDAYAMARAIGTVLQRDTQAERMRLTAITRRHFAFDRYVSDLFCLAQPTAARISVVVPSFNYARYMVARLESIFAQTHPVLEVIVLDDASADGSVALAREAAARAGRDISVIENASNSGSVFHQWQVAAEQARGEWLWIAEADDLADPTFLDTLVRAVDAAPRAALAFTDSRTIDGDGRPVWPNYKAYYAELHPGALATDGVYAGPEFLRRFLAERNLILNASAVLWRRSELLGALSRCAKELDQYRMAGDWRLYAELLAGTTGQIAYVAKPLNVHRRHDDSVTHALEGATHVDEIARMHRVIARLLDGDAALRTRQRRYRQLVQEQLAERASCTATAAPPDRPVGTAKRSIVR